MDSLAEANEDRVVTLLSTRRKDLVRQAISNQQYRYLLETAIIESDMASIEGLLVEVARDVVDTPWF